MGEFYSTRAFASPRVVLVLLPDRPGYLVEVEPAVLGVAERVVPRSHERTRACGFVQENVGLFPEDDLVPSPAVHPHGDQVCHRPAEIKGHGFCAEGCVRTERKSIHFHSHGQHYTRYIRMQVTHALYVGCAMAGFRKQNP